MSEVSASKAQNLNSETFLTALVTNAAILGVELVVFIILKHRLTRIYEPRTYLPPPEKRAVDLPSGPWKWLLAIIAVPTQDVLHKNGVDAYMFLRFLRLLIILFGVVTIFTWLVLLPVDAVNLRDALSADGLVKLSWTNIPPTATKRYAAHIIIVYLSTFFTFYLIRCELQHYTTMRQSFLTSRSHSKLAQARTVLITNIPLEMCNEKALKLWASFVPGGIQNIWIYRDTMVYHSFANSYLSLTIRQDLNKDHQARLDACSKLEAACSKLIRQVVQAKRKEDKAIEKAEKAGRKQAKRKTIMISGGGVLDIEAVEMKEARQEKATIEKREDIETTKNEVDIAEGDASTMRGYSSDTSTRPFGLKRVNTNDLEAGRQFNDPLSVPSISRPPDVMNNQTPEHEEDPNALLQRFVPPNKRPRHRLGFLGLWGQKVDTIEWGKEEIRRLNQAIEEKRKKMDKDAKPLGSAFIQCNLQLGAHVLAQCVSYHEPLMMSEKFIEISPKDVIWDNIDDGAYETRFRYVTSWIATIGLIILWFFPVAIVGTLSNVSSLCQKVSWLCWIPNAPTPIPGIIQGILPPLFLAILFAILPQILRGLAWYENIPRWSLLSMSVYKRYYLFLVIHGFLVITLSSGIAKTASDIVSNPTQAVSLLAAQLPGASIFFLTWTITQGLTGAGSALLQVGVLLLYFIKKWFLGRTPRQAYGVTFLMPKADFGLVLPRISLLATIALAYSVLSPIINGLAMVAFMLFFFSWKFLLTWVFDQPEESETGGQYFPLAINFLFVGLYIEQFCLAALFFLKISQGIAFLAQGILMLVLMGLTVSVQVLFQKSFEPITTFLPMSLATKKMEERWEHDHKIHRHESVHQPNADSDSEDDGDFDLFSRQRVSSIHTSFVIFET
ncbi:hypothetical protein C8Q75DRAFT_139060 [Abortiporus biennis]|nr:hypothetical protein C8Q75DRAFT_139060 [Abortiporus biennis]